MNQLFRRADLTVKQPIYMLFLILFTDASKDGSVMVSPIKHLMNN